MFTKQHYEAIAKIIRDNTTVVIAIDASIIFRDSLVYELADYFLKDNPNFDREKFIKACKEE